MTDHLRHYESRTAVPMVLLALAFVAVYGVPIVWTDLPAGVHALLASVNLAIWLLFAADLAIRAYLSGRWVRFLATHPVDVLIVVLPVLRPLRILRVFTVAHTLITRSGHISVLRAMQAIAVSAALLVFVGALAVLDAERAAGSDGIRNLGDALWWSLATVTTVGYGDITPVTGLGRVVAAVQMLVGISLVGAITSTLATWFITRVQTEAEPPAPAAGAGQESGAGQDAPAASAQPAGTGGDHVLDLTRPGDLEARLAGLERQLAEIHALLAARDQP